MTPRPDDAELNPSAERLSETPQEILWKKLGLLCTQKLAGYLELKDFKEKSISLIKSHEAEIRSAALEESAKIVNGYSYSEGLCVDSDMEEVADAIRDLKSKATK